MQVNFDQPIAHWADRQPTSYCHLADFLPRQLALDLYQESLTLPDQQWREFTRNGSYMRELNCVAPNERAHQLISLMHSTAVLDRLETLTGITGLIPDPHLTGAGWSQSGPGHTLKRHTDFNWLERLKLHRAVSVIIYLNPNWQPQWGGALEFYDHLGREVQAHAECQFNSCVIWKYDPLGYHGYEQPLTCPEDQYRTTFRFFYYTSNSKYNPVDLPHRSLYWKDPFTGLPTDQDYEFKMNTDDQPPIPAFDSDQLRALASITEQVTKNRTNVDPKLELFCYYDHQDFSNLILEQPYHVSASDNSINRKFFDSAGFKTIVSKDYDQGRGIYPIELDGLPAKWSGFDHPQFGHVLEAVPQPVIEAACKGQVIIALMSPGEGFSLTHKGHDCFKAMHRAMLKLGLPAMSVILADGNRGFPKEYQQWCKDNKFAPMFGHSYMLTCFYYFDNRLHQNSMLSHAMLDPEARDYNSLNKTVRAHRTDHIYSLAAAGILSNGLVSGHINDRVSPRFVNTDPESYTRLLNNTCPLTIDGDWSVDNPDTDSTAIFNLKIYEKSLLSFVTETLFDMPGMFLTEKSFKAIAGGHPFIMLAQPNYLTALEELGFRVDFEGIDRSYDLELDHSKRFKMAHDQLINWVSLPKERKLECISQSMPNITHNLNFLRSKDFLKESYYNLLLKANRIFKNGNN